MEAVSGEQHSRHAQGHSETENAQLFIKNGRQVAQYIGEKFHFGRAKSDLKPISQWLIKD
ncbi:MAG: hypothetical protein AAGB04_22655 [Pseudomonadota bacterium]